MFEYSIKPNKKQRGNFLEVIAQSSRQIYNVIQRKNKLKNIKLCISVNIKLAKLVIDTSIPEQPQETCVKINPWFSTKSKPIIGRNKNNIVKVIETYLANIIKQIENFVGEGSGWTIVSVKEIRLQLARYVPFKGGRKRLQKISILCPTIQRTRSVIYIPCPDNKCFLYAVIANLLKKKKHEVKTYAQIQSLAHHFNLLNTKNIEFPVTANMLPVFEKDNNITMTVFEFNEKNILPCYVTSKQTIGLRHVNLLLYKDHFYSIRNLSRFLKSAKQPCSRQNQSYCIFCFTGFKSQHLCSQHMKLCRKEIPKCLFKQRKIKFENYSKQFPSPFIWYYDYECLNQKVNENKTKLQNTTCTKYLKEEIPFAVCIVRWCSNPEFMKGPICYFGNDVVNKFFDHMDNEYKDVMSIIQHQSKLPMIITNTDEQIFQKSTNCSFCLKDFDSNDYNLRKVRHHDHITRRFICALCNCCNLRYASLLQPSFSVFAHNATRFDSHFLVHGASRYLTKNINIVPRNSENFLQCTFNRLNYRDSFALLPGSLSALADNMAASDGKFSITQLYSRAPKLAKAKGVMCYDYLDTMDKLSTKTLPPIEMFYNCLKEQPCSQRDYKFAEKVWTKLKCKSMYDFVQFYLETDTLLLADIMNHFFTTGFQEYGLDPSKYLSLSQYAWDAALKFTKIELDSIPDSTIYDMITNGIRGGICNVGNLRHFKANNKQLHTFDPKLPLTHLIQLDCVSLYSYAMLQPLPIGNFVFLTKEDVAKFHFNHPQSKQRSYNFLLEVDLSCPLEYQDNHKKFPLCPNHIEITKDILSPFNKGLLKQHKCSATKSKKLTSNFFDKLNYIVLYDTLKFYLKRGMKLAKIHRIVKFDQAPWMKPFVEYNISQRQKAVSKFGSDFFKLINNSCYGYSLLRVEKHKDIKLVTNESSFNRYSSRHTYEQGNYISKDLAIIQLAKNKVEIKQPNYVGMAILDISKEHIFKFVYENIMDVYPKTELIYFDTDGGVFAFKEFQDIEKDFLKKHSELFDFSSYPKDSFLYTNKKKKVPGLWANETAGFYISEVVALRSKMYCLKLHNNSVVAKAKGVKKHLINKYTFKHYLNCLLQSKRTFEQFKQFRSRNHKIYMLDCTKASLSSFNDKLFLLDAVNALPYGYHTLNQIQPCEQEKRKIETVSGISTLQKNNQIDMPGKHKLKDSPSNDSKRFKVTARKSVAVNVYNEKAFLHFHDSNNIEKQFSLSLYETRKISKLMPDIIAEMEGMEHATEQDKKAKKSKKQTANESFNKLKKTKENKARAENEDSTDDQTDVISDSDDD